MGVDGWGEETESRDSHAMFCSDVQFWAVGVAKVTGPIEASHVSHLEALEPDMLWDHSLKHMVAIFTEGWGAERERKGYKRT